MFRIDVASDQAVVKHPEQVEIGALRRLGRLPVKGGCSQKRRSAGSEHLTERQVST
jgi:hypothetical protein